ncbi:HD family hydrolase [Candidatus Latescibacterota bacterium]
MTADRLAQQLDFIAAMDQLKHVLRQTFLIDDHRRENDAEHSWHLCLMAIALAEHANEEVDLLRVLKMVILHDLVEIDAGDTFAYDVEGNRDKEDREALAADRIFGLLPDEQGRELRTLWEEFEGRRSPEARFAAALDRLQPMLLNYRGGGEAWRRHDVRAPQVVERNRHIAEGSQALWEYGRELIERAVSEGKLAE